MKELLLYMAKNLVDDPEAVTVTEIDGDDGKVLELRVAEGDMGKVIGRQGRIAKEIRTIIKTVAQRTGEKVTVEIVDSTRMRDVTVTHFFFWDSFVHRQRIIRSVSGYET